MNALLAAINGGDYVRPRFVSNNAVDLRNGDTNFVGQRLLRHASRGIASANGTDNRISQFCMGKSLPLCLASLFYLVSVVVALSAEKEMAGIYADGVVATMQNVDVIRDCTEVQFPRDAVCEQDRADFISTLIKPTVTMTCQLTSPKPATICLRDLFPKPISKRSVEIVVASLRAERAMLSTSLTCPSQKRASAIVARI